MIFTLMPAFLQPKSRGVIDKQPNGEDVSTTTRPLSLKKCGAHNEEEMELALRGMKGSKLE